MYAFNYFTSLERSSFKMFVSCVCIALKLHCWRNNDEILVYINKERNRGLWEHDLDFREGDDTPKCFSNLVN